MFAGVTRTCIQPNKLDEFTKVVQESVFPASKTQKVFRGVYALVDCKKGKSMAISFWETEADAIDSQKSGHYQKQTAKVASYLTEEPVFEGYEVVAQG